MEIVGWNYLGSDFKTFHNYQGSGTPDKIMRHQSNILNCRIQRGHEIGTDHARIILIISTNPIKIRTTVRDNHNLVDWILFQVHIMK